MSKKSQTISGLMSKVREIVAILVGAGALFAIGHADDRAGLSSKSKLKFADCPLPGIAGRKWERE